MKNWPFSNGRCGSTDRAIQKAPAFLNYLKTGSFWKIFEKLKINVKNYEKLSQSRVNLQILSAAFFSKIYFFSSALKTRKGCRYRDSVRASEFATSSPSILKMCKKWIGATGEPGYCVKVGWKEVKKRGSCQIFASFAE